MVGASCDCYNPCSQWVGIIRNLYNGVGSCPDAVRYFSSYECLQAIQSTQNRCTQGTTMKSLPTKTKLYLISIYLMGFAIFMWHINHIEINQPWLLVILCVLASLALVFKVVGATSNSHYAFSFLIYGFSFIALGLPSTLIV